MNADNLKKTVRFHAGKLPAVCGTEHWLSPPDPMSFPAARRCGAPCGWRWYAR